MEKGARTIDMRKRYIADGLVADTLLGAAIGDIAGSKREGLQRNVFSICMKSPAIGGVLPLNMNNNQQFYLYLQC